MKERVKQVIDELRELVEKARASLDDRPVLQAALGELRVKAAEAETEADAEDAEEAKAEKASGCEA